MVKNASSQAAWALLTEGVTKARLETHRLQHLLNRAIELVENSEHKEDFYQAAGDVIVAVPDRVEQIIRALDRTSLALSRMGEDFLDSRLPLSDKTMVDEAIESAFHPTREAESLQRVVDAYLNRKL